MLHINYIKLLIFLKVYFFLQNILFKCFPQQQGLQISNNHTSPIIGDNQYKAE